MHKCIYVSLHRSTAFIYPLPCLTKSFLLSENTVLVIFGCASGIWLYDPLMIPRGKISMTLAIP